MITAANITINVKDLDKSISFYKSIGFTELLRWGNHYAQMTAAEMTIGLHPTTDNNLHSGSGNISIGFKTDNFNEVKQLLSDLNIITQAREEEGGQFIHFHDPDGNALYFINPKV